LIIAILKSQQSLFLVLFS